MTGKHFRPKYPYGPRPQPSAAFSYDHNQCRQWFDVWLSRGGTVARDTIAVRRARDLPDLRSFEDREIWMRIAMALRFKRATLRLGVLSAEIRAASHPPEAATIVQFKPRPQR
jgi:hypothetical protein